MPRTRNPDRDLTDQAAAALDPRLVADLQAAYRQPPPLDAVDVAIRRAVEARVAQRALPLQRVRSSRLHPRLSVPIAALVVLMLSVGAYLHGQSPTPVSAQTIFRQAATAGLAPNQITKFAYQTTNTNGNGSTVQFWVQADANGQPARLGFDPSPAYDTATRFLVGSYEDIVGHKSPASLAGSQVTGQQTFDGSLVDVVKASSGATLYFDAQTYMLRGADWTDLQQGGAQHGANSTWHAQLLQYAPVPASEAPALPWTIDLNGFSQGSATTQKSATTSVSR